MASSVSLPLVVWHNFTNPNTTCITSSYPNVYAGQKDGHIWVYTVSESNPSQLQVRIIQCNKTQLRFIKVPKKIAQASSGWSQNSCGCFMYYENRDRRSIEI